MTEDTLRGHFIFFKDSAWFYCDTGEPTVGNHRGCGLCKKDDTIKGHDGCLGTLPGVKNACCGHGKPSEAYIQYWDGTWVSGDKILDVI